MALTRNNRARNPVPLDVLLESLRPARLAEMAAAVGVLVDDRRPPQEIARRLAAASVDPVRLCDACTAAERVELCQKLGIDVGELPESLVRTYLARAIAEIPPLARPPVEPRRTLPGRAPAAEDTAPVLPDNVRREMKIAVAHREEARIADDLRLAHARLRFALGRALWGGGITLAISFVLMREGWVSLGRAPLGAVCACAIAWLGCAPATGMVVYGVPMVAYSIVFFGSAFGLVIPLPLLLSLGWILGMDAQKHHADGFACLPTLARVEELHKAHAREVPPEPIPPPLPEDRPG